jgi:hypothetical protein
MRAKVRFATAILVVPFLTVMGASIVTTVAGADRDHDQDRHDDGARSGRGFDRTIGDNTEKLFGRGREIFRDDTFGDEHFWGDTLKLHQAIGGARFGGVGPGVSPATALAVGLKVDVDRVPDRSSKASPPDASISLTSGDNVGYS